MRQLDGVLLHLGGHGEQLRARVEPDVVGGRREVEEGLLGLGVAGGDEGGGGVEVDHAGVGAGGDVAAVGRDGDGGAADGAVVDEAGDAVAARAEIPQVDLAGDCNRK